MKIYVLGDSISIGYGPQLQTCLQGIVQYSRKEGEEEALLNLDNPTGANGGDSGMVLRFLKSKEAAGGIDADLLLLNCGLHDIKKSPTSGTNQVPIELYEENLRSVIDVVSKAGPRLIWIRTTPCDEAVHNHAGMEFHRFASDCDAYNRAADHIMSEAGVPVVDLHTLTLNLGPDLYRDHVHFHPAIEEKQGAFLAGWVIAFLTAGKR